MAQKKKTTDRASSRSAARLAAVQALYQMDMTGIDLNDVVAEFQMHRLGQVVEGDHYHEAEAEFFHDLVDGVVREQRQLDPMLDQQLAEGWRLNRVDSILRALLRSAAFELYIRDDVPSRVVINEYVDIAHAFFDGEEPKVVNGVLDRLARKVRSEEFARAALREG
ncbi:transcription antitermination factor NusB [Methyloceanibacter sp. wino2]|uniref:transcription antitermination factor NusB n=1 Tax=Methyloceanibacter sp. wino2 TaxID=2170729 RepID=UPI000D3E6B58|nr:transcription antitermination factor NusB [Methyloceanibacter sp. wino2]